MRAVLLMIGLISVWGCGSSAPLLDVPDYRRVAGDRLEQARQAERKGDVERALALYASAISLEPMLPEAHLGRARLYERLDLVTDAERSYAMAIETAPLEERPPYHFQRGLYYRRAGRPESALRDFERCIDLLRDRPEASLRLEAHLERAITEMDLLRWEQAALNARYVLDRPAGGDLKSRARAILSEIERRRERP